MLIPSGTTVSRGLVASEDETYKAELQEQAMVLLRVLPGQRDAAILWSDFFNDELEEENEFERNLACPTLSQSIRKFSGHSC